MSAEVQLYWGLGYCLLMLILAWLFKRYPPKHINHFYGYRTRKSMRNEQTWKAANSFANSYFIRVSYWSFLLPPLFYFVLPEHNLLWTLILHSVLLVSTLIFTELHLSKLFDKKGNPK